VALGCMAELEHARTILKRGTSAHRQVRVYEEARARGASEREALIAVVDWLIRETASGLD
jgi:carboxylate-amine ligase